VGAALIGLGAALYGQRLHEQAQAHYKRALALYEKTLPLDAPPLAEPLLGLAEVALAQGHPMQALPLLTRALPLAQGSIKADTQYALARALWQAGRERARALQLVSQALAHYQQVGHAPKVAELERWLSTHTPASPKQAP
jgi:tetratricopeptide (TPR) repeat protein